MTITCSVLGEKISKKKKKRKNNGVGGGESKFTGQNLERREDAKARRALIQGQVTLAKPLTLPLLPFSLL